MKKNKYLFFLLITLLIGCDVSVENSFKKTQAGSALYSCVSGSGQLSVKSLGDNLVDAHLIKSNQDVRMQFSIAPDIGQAKLEGAVIAGQSELTKFSLLLKMELMCGGEVTSKIFPDEYNALQLMNSFR